VDGGEFGAEVVEIWVDNWWTCWGQFLLGRKKREKNSKDSEIASH